MKGCSSRISAANDESNKTWMDGRLGQIGRPFNWEFDEFMDFLICHYGRPFRNSLSRLASTRRLFFRWRTKRGKGRQPRQMLPRCNDVSTQMESTAPESITYGDVI